MRKIAVLTMCIAFTALFATLALRADAVKPDHKCKTIQSGELLASDGSVIEIGYDQWGYNYQAHMFNGMYCDSYRDAAWCQPYKDVALMMKWNDAWLSNKDCNVDGVLDRHNGFDTYIGSSAWLTNHQWGEYESWNIVGNWVIDVDYHGSHYIHDMIVNSQAEDGSLLGTGAYPSEGTYSIFWDLTGSVVENDVTLVLDYEGSSYVATLVGTIAENGTMSGTWTSNIGQDGKWTAEGETDPVYEMCNWDYFVKIVAVPEDAYLDNGNWMTADGEEIGPSIWGEFAIIQQVENDECAGLHGAQYISPAGPGLGKF